MLTTSTRRRTARAVAVLASGLLTVGLAQTSSPAVVTERPAAEGPSIAELRALADTLDVGAAFAADDRREARRLDVVSDPGGDADRIEMARRPRPYTRLADLTGVRYKTPSRTAGDLRITTGGRTCATAASRGCACRPRSRSCWGGARDRPGTSR